MIQGLRRVLGRSPAPAGDRAGTELVFDSAPTETKVRLMLDRMRTCRWTNLEAIRFKRLTGIDLWRDEIRPLDWDIEQFMTFLAVACSAEDPEVTAEQLAPHVAGEKGLEAMATVLMLIGDWVPPFDEAVGENPQVASALTRMHGTAGRSPSTASESPPTSTGSSAPASSTGSKSSG